MKSVFSGVMLVLFFGPFGVMYANIGAGLLFCVLNVFGLAVLLLAHSWIALLLIWTLEFVTVVVQVRRHNEEWQETIAAGAAQAAQQIAKRAPS